MSGNFLDTEEVIRATQGTLVGGDMGIVFSGVSTDTRTLRPGELFVALKGPRYDGHDFWREALKRGAKGLLLSRLPREMRLEEVPKTVSVILVRDTLQALGDLARAFKRRRGFWALAISGSCGKTTTKEMCAAVLSRRYPVFRNPGNYNNLVGLPLSVLSVPEEVRFGVFELGISLPGEMARLVEILEPEAALLTNVRPAHLEGLGSMEGVLSEKFQLYQRLPAGARLIVNRDEEEIFRRAQDLPHERITYGLHMEAEVRAEDVRISPEGTEFALLVEGRRLGEGRLRFLGEHFVRNALAAVAAGLLYGVPPEEALSALSELSPLPGRLFPLSTGRYFLLDDSYNANPGSVYEALRVFWEIGQRFRERVAILGDMRELGPEAEAFHESVGRLAGRLCHRVLAVGEMAPVVAREAERMGARGRAYPSVEELLSDLEIPEGAAVLVKGSRAVGLERVVQKLKEEP
ncbi:UDP-N-acetylmuramoyl-tripeptide--D-alanyl-D-alanine ligase [Thermosulfurimonas marina]|uniref:UDP-N-acetylmuramoyl-tripeptide--D-alanyl-D-alanine ligase n=1 Tax=Thermosulfurimonas marina TaxID=2047767 RepID=A0A6H1WRF5_9BACT|nr:UDP-N-acetylmuramoyl-tripeptide--D-alanyl-D-alanine ligase [Thermosulfurimonas marina]QJA05761.1 UDP-N-acetylmuramoyl-tripeptide--D-alanyl-D-alanine ligase [Thermosulfurimonas marina]